MNFKRFIVPGALALSWGCFGQTGPHADPAAGTRASVLSVDQAVAEAREANPDIRAAVRRLSLAQIKTTTARSLDDPMLMVRDWQTPAPEALGPEPGAVDVHGPADVSQSREARHARPRRRRQRRARCRRPGNDAPGSGGPGAQDLRRSDPQCRCIQAARPSGRVAQRSAVGRARRIYHRQGFASRRAAGTDGRDPPQRAHDRVGTGARLNARAVERAARPQAG